MTWIQDIEVSLLLHCSQNEAAEIDSKDNIEPVHERLCLTLRMSCLYISCLHLLLKNEQSCEATMTLNHRGNCDVDSENFKEIPQPPGVQRKEALMGLYVTLNQGWQFL